MVDLASNLKKKTLKRLIQKSIFNCLDDQKVQNSNHHGSGFLKNTFGHTDLISSYDTVTGTVDRVNWGLSLSCLWRASCKKHKDGLEKHRLS